MIFKILCTYLIVINIIAFSAFGLDKYYAVKNKWRISEGTLILLCALGGSVAGLIAMSLFRHKIRKPKFFLGVPVILIFQIGLILWIKLNI